MHLDDYNCGLCGLQTEGTVKHLFLYCPFSQDCWALLGIFWDTSLHSLQMKPLVPAFLEKI